MNDFIKAQFDKLLLTFLVLVCLGTVLHLIHHTADASVVNWGLSLVSGVIGALLTLITGNVLKSTAGKAIIAAGEETPSGKGPTQ